MRPVLLIFQHPRYYKPSVFLPCVQGGNKFCGFLAFFTCTKDEIWIGGLSYFWQVRAFRGRYSIDANGENAWMSFSTEGPPGAFAKIDLPPIDPNQAVDLALSWESSPRAERYEYCIQTDPGPDCTAGWISTQEASVSVLGVMPNTNYYWQVRALAGHYSVEADGENAWGTFTIEEPPHPFDKVSPPDGSNGLPSDLTLSWSTSTWAENYEYCLSTNPYVPCDTGWKLIDGTSVHIRGLSHGVTYYWQVRALAGNHTTSAGDGAWWSFRTAGPPEPFGKHDPPDASIEMPLNLTLSWSTSLWSDGYEFCYQTSPDEGCNRSWISTRENRIEIDDLQVNTTYYWQVRALAGQYTVSADGESSWWSFTTEGPPGDFNKLGPLDAGDRQPLNLLLSWTPSSRAQYYQYCLVTTPSETCNATWVRTGSSMVFLNDLDPNTTYYWQVRAYNGSYATAADGENTWWSFTTEGPPGPFWKTEPEESADRQPLDLLLTWESSPRADRYEYCLDTTPGFFCTSSWVSTQETSAALKDLVANTTYYWQVRAYAGTYLIEADRQNEWWSFTTDGPPGPFLKLTPLNRSSDHPRTTSLSWSSSLRSQYYEICVDTVDDNECGGQWQAVSENNLRLSELDYGVTYYWQVRSVGGIYQQSANGEDTWWSFSTAEEGPPAAFSKLSASTIPMDREGAYLLSWTPSRRADRYEYCIETTRSNTCESGWVEAEGTSARVTDLSTGSVYYWQVRAFSGSYSIEANWQNWWPFIVVEQPLYPARFPMIDIPGP